MDDLYEFEESQEPYEPEIFEPEPIEMPIVDKILYGDDWAKGYLNDEVVISFGGVSDINAIELYDIEGNRVIPELAPTEPNLTEFYLGLVEQLST